MKASMENNPHICALYPFCIEHQYCYAIFQSLLLCGKHSWYMCHASPSSPTNSVVDMATESKSNPPSYVTIQGWQLLCMCVSLFIPKQSVMWLVKLHLQRNADTRWELLSLVR